ncbi:L-histidine N(alpha)-methyltransferase [Candidatus Pacearchaeota archaeon]|nr:L-histidine N(alpha)-methyltransferase [Candidatus Pacearchaeota archaeon]
MVNPTIFKELVKRGYSIRGNTRVWDISDSKLWYVTPELAEGFRGLENYEPYRKNIIKREIDLIHAHADAIVKDSGATTFNVVDLGCSTGMKAEEFLKSIPSSVNIRYCPVDISSHFVDEAVKRIKGLNLKNVKEIKPFVSDFQDLDTVLAMARSADYGTNVVLLMGSTISTYEICDFLFTLSQPMIKGDVFIAGNGIRSGERFVELDKYKHPLFNSWFIPLIRGLGFSDNEVTYDARFAHGRVEGFYTINIDKTLNHNGKNITFKKGDEIIVAIQYKYYDAEFADFGKMYFNDVSIIKDSEGEYCLMVCKK